MESCFFSTREGVELMDMYESGLFCTQLTRMLNFYLQVNGIRLYHGAARISFPFTT
jgi:hypothetical protein